MNLLFNTLRLSALLAGAALLAAALNAQPGPDPFFDGEGPTPRGFPPELLLDLPEAIELLREEKHALMQDLQAARRAYVEAYRQAYPDATRQELVDALQLWRRDNAATFEALDALNAELRAALQEAYPEMPLPPERTAIPDAIIDQQQQVMENRAALRTSRQTFIEDYRAAYPDATDEEVHQALREQWQPANAALIEETRALAEATRAWFQDNRPVRGERWMRDRLRERRETFRDSTGPYHAKRSEIQALLRDATPEQRAALLEALRDLRKEMRAVQREQRRQERLGAGAQGGAGRQPE